MKLPPGADYLADQVRQGHPEIVIIFMGKDAFNRAIHLKPYLPTTLYFPLYESPYNYRWPVFGCEIYLVDTQISKLSFIQTCAICFFSFGATKINYISRNQCRSFKHGR